MASPKSQELKPDANFATFLDDLREPEVEHHADHARSGAAYHDAFASFVAKWQAGKVRQTCTTGLAERRQADRRPAQAGGRRRAVSLPAPRRVRRHRPPAVDRRRAKRSAAWRRRGARARPHEPLARRLLRLLRLPARDERVPVVHALRPALVRRAGSGSRTTATCSRTDPQVWPAVKNTLWLIAIAVPLQVLFAFGIAMMLARARRGVGIFRTIFYLPALAPPVAATLGFVYLLNPATGPVNTPSGSSGSRGRSGSTARVVEAFARPCSRLGRRQHDGHLPGRHPRRAAASLRVRRARRRGPLPAAALGHAADDQPGDPLRGRDRRDRGAAVLHAGLRRGSVAAGQASQAGTVAARASATRRTRRSSTPCCSTSTASATSTWATPRRWRCCCWSSRSRSRS